MAKHREEKSKKIILIILGADSGGKRQLLPGKDNKDCNYRLAERMRQNQARWAAKKGS